MAQPDYLTDDDIDEVRDLLAEAARYLGAPLNWWKIGKAWNARRHDLITALKTKAMGLDLQT